MDVVSRHINREALKEVAQEFDVTVDDARKIVKIYADYIYWNVNQLDLTKDLDKQYTRMKVPYIGEVHISPCFIFENKYQHKRFTDFEYKWIRTWYSRTFAYFADRLEEFRKNLKTTDND